MIPGDLYVAIIVLVVENPAYRSHETASETTSDNLEVI